MRPVLFSDIDGTFLCDGEDDEVLARRLAGAVTQAEIVFVSSRTIADIARLFARWGWDGDAIGENGAHTMTRDPALAEALAAGRGRGDDGGDRGDGRAAAGIADAVQSVAREVGWEIGVVHTEGRRSSCLLPGRLRADPRYAEFAEALARLGLNVSHGGDWVSAWRGPDKGEAAWQYLAAVAAILGSRPRSAAIGNAENDLPLLLACDHRFVIRDPGSGHHQLLAAVPGAHLLREPACAGWLEAVRLLAPQDT